MKTTISDKLKSLEDEVDKKYQVAARELQKKKRDLVTRQKRERHQLAKRQKKRRQIETRQRFDRLPRGLKALFWGISGRLRSLKEVLESEAQQSDRRDQAQWQALIETQLLERRILQREFRQYHAQMNTEHEMVNRDMANHATHPGGRSDPRKNFGVANLTDRRLTRRR